MTLGAIIACGGSATVEPAPRFTPGVAATAMPDTSEKMEGTKAPVAEATKAMEQMSGPVEQVGTVVVAMRNLRAGAGTPRFCTAGCSETIYQLAIGETITAVEAGPGGVLDPRDTPRLALSWELSPDQKYMDFKLREDVKFHKDYGEMTAEDVAFSYNDANAFTTPESIHGQAGDFAPLIANVEALDPYNVRFHFTLFHQAMPMRYMGPFYQSAAIVPKSAFDRHGVEGMRDIFIGTGPFIFDEWKKSESLTAHSVTEHYRKVPAIKDVRILDIPEAAARVAMLETGDAQIGGELPFKDIVRLQRKGFELQRENGLAHERGLFFSGNYWETEHPISGKALTRPREPKPWIGFVDDAESMEKARKVRWAMSMAIDREGLNDSLVEGLGEVCYLNQISINQPGWQDKWEIPYDPEGAKQMLADAGYPDGFEAQLWVGPGGFTAELGDAVAGLWLKNLNIDTTVDRITYTKFRPTLVQRTNTQIYSSAGDEGKTGFPVHWPKGFQGSALTDGGWGPGFEDPFYTTHLFKMNDENDAEKRLAMAEEYFDHVYEQMVQPCFIEVPFHPMYNPELIAEWSLYPNMNGSISGAANFETIVLK
jgi:ABC-type transport system substrate-binding protein